jgi:SAM-dependent methyltransferase
MSKHYFEPSLISIFFNRYFIIRSGLFNGLKNLSNEIAGKILDFGCGSKPYEGLFINQQQYVGLDVEVSGHNHSDSKIDVFYDGKVIPFTDGEFDSVVAFEVVEHIFDLDISLTEINRILKDGGNFLFTIPFGWEEHEQPYDFARYTSFGIKSLLEKHGFEVVALNKTNNFILALAQNLISYIDTSVLPQKLPFGHTILTIFIISPITILGLIFSKILPSNTNYYSNLVVLAKKPIK